MPITTLEYRQPGERSHRCGIELGETPDGQQAVVVFVELPGKPIAHVIEDLAQYALVKYVAPMSLAHAKAPLEVVFYHYHPPRHGQPSALFRVKFSMYDHVEREFKHPTWCEADAVEFRG